MMGPPIETSTRTLRVGGAGHLLFRRYRLRMEGQRGATAGVLIERRHATIGTGAGNDLVVTDPAVSRIHCEIVVDERGYLLRDLDSKNGTFVDGLRILAAYLESGSVISIGGSRVVFSPESDEVKVPILAGDRFGKLLGSSLEMRALYAVLEKVAAQDVTVLIQGESGSGKDVVANEIHEHSPRRAEPLVVFDCGSVPEALAESELFGHVKGAFTGATSDRAGAFEQANGGTLFLDEIGELPLVLQPRLLRALESREIRPVGASAMRRCDVRVVAATNRDLKEEVKRGAFREDLFFRLNVVTLRVPPVRHRREDVPQLIESFLSKASRGKGKAAQVSIPPDTMAMLSTWAWPGNVRELRNFVERYLVFAPADAAAAARLLGGDENSAERVKKGTGLVVRFDLPFKEAKARVIDTLEVQYVRRLLDRNKGNVSAAAREGGIHRKYVEILVKKHGLK